VIIAHKIKINPTPQQGNLLAQAAGIQRLAFNWGLAEWKHQKELGNKSCGALTLKKMFRAISREQFPFVAGLPSCVIDGAFANLAKALKNYFKRKDAVGFPNFKSKHKTTPSFYLANTRFKVEGHTVKMSMMGEYNLAEELRFTGKIMSGTVSRQGGDWVISVLVECEPLQHIHKAEAIGVDVGIKTMATVSDGAEFDNPRAAAQSLRKIKRLGKELSRRTQGSGRWQRTKEKLGKLHAHIANQRAHATHQASHYVSAQAQIVCIEDLNVAGMAKNKRLAGAVADANMGELLRQIEYKTIAHGGELVKVSRWYASSKTCADCGTINRALTLSDRTWVCESCGVTHERDFNASQNILAEGLRIRAAG